MHTTLRRLLPSLAIAAAACSDTATSTGPASFSFGVGGLCTAMTTGVQPPINADGSSNFQNTRTIPVKIRFTDCDGSGNPLNTLTPTLKLEQTGGASGMVNELVSSSAADDGTTMRLAGDGQYIFNLSTKRSQFNAGQDLVSGRYLLTIYTDATFTTELYHVNFDLRN
ncbi:MAG: hypothetical protein H0U85_04740 [Gemmatimonadales bacterium]|nr:hypothetical protein [Gemmatimonadales bacterium]